MPNDISDDVLNWGGSFAKVPGVAKDSGSGGAAVASVAQPVALAASPAGAPAGDDAALAAAVQAKDWATVAGLLNTYSDADIDKKIAQLQISAGQLELIHDAAAKDPSIAHIADLTANIMIGGKPDSPNAATNDMKASLIQAANNVQRAAETNGLAYGFAVAQACQDFKAYAKPKLEAKKSELTAGDLAEALVSLAIPKVGDLIGELVHNEIGKKVVSGIADVAKDKLGLGKMVNSQDSDIAALEKVVDDLAAAATGAARDIQGAVVSVIKKPCDDVIAAANRMTGDTALNDAGQDFIGPFYKATDDAVQAALEGYGVPSINTSKKSQVKIYTSLVKGFEKALYSSGYTAQDRSVMTSAQLDAEADAMADKAAQAAKVAKEAEMAPQH